MCVRVSQYMFTMNLRPINELKIKMCLVKTLKHLTLLNVTQTQFSMREVLHPPRSVFSAIVNTVYGGKWPQRPKPCRHTALKP